MFERFTDTARTVVVQAQADARLLQHDQITPDHLLLGVLSNENSPAATVLGDLGLDRDRLVTHIARLGTADSEALRAVGIDLPAVRRRVEQAFGASALDGPRKRRPRSFWRGAHLPFSRPAKQALNASLREAVSLRSDSIELEHVLLGLLSDPDAPAAQTLQQLGIGAADVRAKVTAALREAV